MSTGILDDSRVQQRLDGSLEIRHDGQVFRALHIPHLDWCVYVSPDMTLANLDGTLAVKFESAEQAAEAVLNSRPE